MARHYRQAANPKRLGQAVIDRLAKTGGRTPPELQAVTALGSDWIGPTVLGGINIENQSTKGSARAASRLLAQY